MLFKISLKQYSALSIPVANPVDTSKLPAGKTYQVTSQYFILQFLLSGKTLTGIIMKRDKSKGIRLRWCLFRNCERNNNDYIVIIADPYSPPYEDNLFTVTLPYGIQYEFQGLDFYTPL